MITPNITEDPYAAFSEYLKATHPSMFQNYSACEVGTGWFKVIKSLCQGIDDYTSWKNKEFTRTGQVVEPVVVQQIKEKFGHLRFYYRGGDDYVHGMVQMAEKWANETCDQCGATGTRRAGGWIRTLCDEHEAQRRQRTTEDDE